MPEDDPREDDARVPLVRTRARADVQRARKPGLLRVDVELDVLEVGREVQHVEDETARRLAPGTLRRMEHAHEGEACPDERELDDAAEELETGAGALRASVSAERAGASNEDVRRLDSTGARPTGATGCGSGELGRRGRGDSVYRLSTLDAPDVLPRRRNQGLNPSERFSTIMR
jgi:hypothetical protein